MCLVYSVRHYKYVFPVTEENGEKAESVVLRALLYSEDICVVWLQGGRATREKGKYKERKTERRKCNEQRQSTQGGLYHK